MACPRFPVDGVENVASVVLLADRRAGRRSGWLPWTALTSGTVASLAANIATADYGIISRVIAGWPAIALLIAVKLLSGILEYRPTQTAPGTASPGIANVDGTVPGTADLITAARDARDALHQDGQPLTRNALAARLRAACHPVRYSRLTPLLQTLRTDPATQTP
jgi:hypothetical protein